MECIQWVAWRTSSVWLSWCLHAFGRSKSSDARPWANKRTEFWQHVSRQTLWDFLIFIYQEGQCTRKELWLHGMLVDGKNIDISIQTSLESPQFKLAWNEGKWYKLYAGACILCIPAFTTITTNISQNGAEAAGVFLVYMLGLTTSRDGFWVIEILPWQDSDKAKSSTAYNLAFTGPSDIHCLNVPSAFLHWSLFFAAQLRKLFAPYDVRKCKYHFKR